MERIKSKLTVFFDHPFWIGIYEREGESGYEVCKITFGPEPRDYEVHNFILKNWEKLRFSPSMETASIVKTRVNPKRMQREVQKQLQDTGIGTKAQQALKLLQEQGKKERLVYNRMQREEEQERKFELRQEKRKEKHRGH